MAAPAAVEAPKAPKPRFVARLRYARMSARKMRYVVDLIRGKDYNSAMAILKVCRRRGAPFCMKLLESAMGNALDLARTRNLEVDANALHLVDARVEGGPILKRWRPSSMRRPTMIRKRTCHMTFVLEERPLKESRREKARRQRQERQKAASAKPSKARAAPPTPGMGGAPPAAAEGGPPPTPPPKTKKG